MFDSDTAARHVCAVWFAYHQREFGFVGDVRTVLHVINEGSQLRHYLPVERIVESS
jgi:hypothetical protein